MINIMKMKLYPTFSRMISISTNEDKPYNIIFLSENSTFMDVYAKLNIRRQFVKRITHIPFKIPRVIANLKNLMPYKIKLGLLPTTTPSANNVYIDTQPFFNILDSRYGKQSYKRPAVFQKVVAYLNSAKLFGNAKTILIYHVNLSKPVPSQFLYRRSIILALMAQIGEGSLPFDNVALAIERDGSIKFASIYNKQQKPLPFQRIVSILKRLVPKEEEVVDDAAMNNDQELRTESMRIIRTEAEKESILNFIYKHQKKKILTS